MLQADIAIPSIAQEEYSELEKLNHFFLSNTLNTKQCQIFTSSICCFNRYIPSGIVALSSRVADQLQEIEPFLCHEIAANVLKAATDEFGMHGTNTHYQLMIQFGEALGVERADLNVGRYSVESAKVLGLKLKEWYRQSPVPFGLGVHIASEQTSFDEYTSWFKAFTSDRYPLIQEDSPAHFYLKIHAELEGDHNNDSVDAVKSYISYFPESVGEFRAGMDAYLSLYNQMMSDIRESLIQR